MSKLPLNSIRRFVNNARVLRIAGTLLAALIISSCEEYPTPYQPGLYPRAAPAGFWNDEGASGKPRIIVHIGEQKAYFYKGKTLVGETTVSTGKPGFSTPPGHYTVISKSADHVSSLFGDYVDDYGNVVRSNIDSRKDAVRKGPISMARECRMPCSSEAVTRCIRATSRPLPRRTVASVCRHRWPSRFFENAPVGTSVTVTE